MRKTDIRKWVHGILDLLPLLVIPVFMVYSHRHTIESNSVEVPVNTVADFNQQRPNFVSYESTVFDVDVQSSTTGIVYLSGSPSFAGGRNSYSPFTDYQTISFYKGHVYYYQSNLDTLTSYGLSFYLNDAYSSSALNGFTSNTVFNFATDKVAFWGLNFTDTSYVYDNLYYSFNIYDLTKMFGSGNEPTKSEFDSYFPFEYYKKIDSKSVLVKGTSTVTYNDTDIGSQFVYSLYNVTNNYFNFNNVFGFGNLQDWFMLNIFGGNAPLSFYIVWQIVLYEFLMDLIFLIYGLFMWFIDMCEKLMNKPLNAIK